MHDPALVLQHAPIGLDLINIGIRHDFLCINICWGPREVLKPEPKRRGFQHLPRCPADDQLMYQKSMFDCYYCIKHFFFRSKTLEKLLQKVLFTCIYNGAETHVTGERFENAASKAKTNVIATVHFTDDDVSFLTAPECLFIKPQSRALTALGLPC